ncbi:MAG: hypothetical protein E7583_11190 [Ruminococcaceae bacterium]|nr:hypothetical protein [Oscillospiraceae bacterium]
MKRTIAVILAFVMCLSLCACGNGNDAPSTEATEDTAESTIKLALGETASTDIVEFTLDEAQESLLRLGH